MINYLPSTSQAPTDSRDILRYKLVSSSSILLPAPAVKPLPKDRSAKRGLLVSPLSRSRPKSGKIERFKSRTSRKAKPTKPNTVPIRVAEMTYDNHKYGARGTLWRSKNGSAPHDALIEMITAHRAVIGDNHLDKITAMIIRAGGLSGYLYEKRESFAATIR